MKITKTLLIRKHACCKQVELFAELFPGGVIVTKEICLQHAGKFNWSWAAHHLLPKPAVEAYDEAVASVEKAYAEAAAPAWEAYNEVVASAWEAYDDAMASAKKACAEVRASAWKAYDEAMVPAEKAYAGAMASAEKAYKKAMAVAFAEAAKEVHS